MSKLLDQLQNKIIPFWLKLKDEEFGGFFGFVSNDLVLEKEANKALINHTRNLYSFSLWYEYFKDEELKLAAKHAYNFLMEAFYDHQYGGFYWLVEHNKKPLKTLKNVYGQAFAIYGLSEYGRVFNDKEAVKRAYELFLLIEKYSFSGDCCYKEQFTRGWNLENNTLVAPENSKLVYTTNTLLHLLEAYTNLYLVYPDEKVKVSITKILNIFKKKLFKSEKGTFYLYIDQSKNIIKKSQSFGHDIEACWLIDRAMEVINLDDQDMKEITLLVAKSAYQNGLTKRGLITENNGGNIYERIWWVQAEAMVGFYNHYQKTNDESYLKAVSDILDYTLNNIVDKRKAGEWFWGVDQDEVPLKKYGMVEDWKAPYHSGRAIIELLKRGCKL